MYRSMIRYRLRGVAVACAALALSAGAPAAAPEAGRPMIVTPFEKAKFAPINPARPDGAQMAVLRGDPATGPSDMLLRLRKGQSPVHIHSSDYHLSLIMGTMKHWGAGQSEADAEMLEPGSYFFQPGSHPHADACLTDECLMFIHWAGKRDARLAD